MARMMRLIFLFASIIAWEQGKTHVFCFSPPADVVLYRHGYLKGTNVSVEFDEDNNCYNLPEDFRKEASSANAFTPVMLCAEINCGGKKSQVTGKTSFLNTFNDMAVSVLKLPLPQPAILYEHTYYSGNQFNVTFSTRGAACENLPDNFANTASSVIASRPVALFTKQNCEGERFNVTTMTVPYLDTMNDMVASVLKVSIPPAAALYRHPMYDGWWVNVFFYWDAQCVNLPYYFADTASSIKVFKPVVLYEREDCEGEKLEVTESSEYLGEFNDRAASLKLL